MSLATRKSVLTDLADVEQSLASAIAGFASTPQPIAIALLVLFVLLDLVLFGLVALFDLVPSWKFGMKAAVTILPPEWLGLAGLVCLLFTFAPSIIELTGGLLVRRRVMVIWPVLLLVLAFDTFSDLADTTAFISTFDPLFITHGGSYAASIRRLAELTWLWCASFGFEALLIISLSVTAQMFYLSQRGRYGH